MRHRTAPTRGLALICACVAFAAAASAESQYVSDQLSINMRSQPGTQYRIEKLLDAGDKLETLGRSHNGWTHVRTAGGQTGYVLSRFLSDQPTARHRVETLQARVDKLGQRKRDLTAQNKSLSRRLNKIRDTSADAVRISKENKTYRKQLMTLRSKVDRLKHENQALVSRRNGMTVGALLLFAGIVLGLLLPLFQRRRRRSGWDSL